MLVQVFIGKALMLFLKEIGLSIDTAKADSELAPFAEELENAVQTLQEVTRSLLGLAQEKGAEAFLADATLYLELFGIITIAWQWLRQGIAAQKALAGKVSKADTNFYQGKLFTLRYFFAYELPKIEGLSRRLMNQDGLTVDMQSDFFAD